MATYLTLKTATKELCGIASGNTSFDTEIGRWLNFGQSDFSSETNWKYIEARGSMASSTFKFKYGLASDLDVIKSVVWEHDHYLRPVNQDQWVRLNLNQSVGTPRYYMIYGGSLQISPQPQNSGKEVSLSVGASATASSLILTPIANLQEKGRIIVDSEVIEYAHADASNNKIEALTRGVEGTAPASHSANAVATQRNIEYDYFKVLSDMSADGDTSSIPTQYHRALPIYASAQFYYKMGEMGQGDKMFQQYLLIKEGAKKDLGEKQAQNWTSVLDDTEADIPIFNNEYPDRGSLSDTT